jgi:hypothetical protein
MIKPPGGRGVASISSRILLCSGVLGSGVFGSGSGVFGSVSSSSGTSVLPIAARIRCSSLGSIECSCLSRSYNACHLLRGFLASSRLSSVACSRYLLAVSRWCAKRNFRQFLKPTNTFSSSSYVSLTISGSAVSNCRATSSSSLSS